MELYKISWFPEDSRNWETVRSIEDDLNCCFVDNGGKVHSHGGIVQGKPAEVRNVSGRVPKPLIRHFKEDVKEFFNSLSTASLKDIKFLESK